STGIRIAFQYDFHPRLYGDRPSFDFAFATPGQGLASTYDRHTRQGQLFESRSKRALALEPSPKPVCSCTKALQVVHSAKDGERTRYRHYESAQRGDGSECARGHQQRTEVRAVEKRLDPEDKVQNQLTEKRKQENTHRARGPQPHRSPPAGGKQRDPQCSRRSVQGTTPGDRRSLYAKSKAVG